MSDYVKLSRHGEVRYVHAWRVNVIMDGAEGSAITVGDNTFYVDEEPEEIIAMLDEIVNGVTRAVSVPNFPGMEK